MKMVLFSADSRINAAVCSASGRPWRVDASSGSPRVVKWYRRPTVGGAFAVRSVHVCACVATEDNMGTGACQLWPFLRAPSVALTASVSHPFSAFFACASWKVLCNTASSLENGGVGRHWGLRSFRSCLTAGGRCFTIFVGVSQNFVQVQPVGVN